MKISNGIYEKLSPNERLVAMFEAMGRDDQEEAKRLTDTCPRKIYTCLDHEFLGKYNELINLSIATYADLLTYALKFVLTSSCAPTESERCLQKMANIQATWNNLLKNYGINPETMAKLEKFRNPAINLLLTMAPEADSTEVGRDVAEIRSYLSS